MAALTIVKGLPLTYNRDLQWATEPLLDSCRHTRQGLAMLAAMIPTLRVDTRRAAQTAAQEDLCATDLAEFLVQRGVAFRDAHEAVGRLLTWAQANQRSLRDTPLAQWRRFSPAFTPAALRLLDARGSVARKRSSGSTNPRQVRAALTAWRRRLRG